MAACVSENTIQGFLLGELSAPDISAIEEHIDVCSRCRSALVRSVAPGGRGSSEAHAAQAFSVGDRVAGRYRVCRFLGRGGMGEVYEVEDEELHEHIALKTVIGGGGDDDRMVARLKRELQLARRVTHPNVCRVFDVGFHATGESGAGRVVFLTMALLAGETLSERLRREGRMSGEMALELARQMAQALAAAHRAGVIHRDFKSDNVILIPDDAVGCGVRAVVTDFGLARIGDSERAHSGTAEAIAGTAAYIAPELVLGEPATPAADVYSLGVVIYEMVTGTWPFVRSAALATAAVRLVKAPVPPRALRPDLDPALERWILRCLDRAPRARPAPEAIASMSPARARRSRRYAIAAAVTMIGSMTAFVVVPGGRPSAVSADTAPRIPPAAAPRPAPPAAASMAVSLRAEPAPAPSPPALTPSPPTNHPPIPSPRPRARTRTVTSTSGAAPGEKPMPATTPPDDVLDAWNSGSR